MMQFASGHRPYGHFIVLFLILFAFKPLPAIAQNVTIDAATLVKLQQIITRQEKLLEQQSRQMNAQSETIESLKTKVDALETRSATVTATPKSSQDSPNVAAPAEPAVGSGNNRIKLSVSGHINRAVNVVDDGSDTETYFVDNDVSSSRLRFVGTGVFSPDRDIGDIVAGTHLELGISPNNSASVSQTNESAGDSIGIRFADIFFRNESLGRLSIGRGQAAADDTAEYDLSLVAGTTVYSSVSDLVGGVQFTNNGVLTGTTIGSAFFNFDGNRQDRVRYDTPTFGPGIQASVSAGSDQRYDMALTWGGDYGDWTGVEIGSFTTLAAVSIQDPNVANVNYRLASSLSAVHNPSGLGLSLSAGKDERDAGDDPYHLYGKVSLDTSIWSVGQTGFGVDASYGEHVIANDDEGHSYGVGAVQKFDGIATEVYLQFRYFDLELANGADPESIVAGSIGTRVKF